MITKITLTEIQDFIVRFVKNNSEFQTLCDTLLGGQLNYYRGANLRGMPEQLPYFTAYKFNSNNQDGQDSEWIVQFIIGIEGVDDPVDDNGVFIFESTDIVEKLAVKSLDIIHQGIRDGMLNNQCLLQIVSENILITEIGEADDVQAIVTLRLETYSIL